MKLAIETIDLDDLSIDDAIQIRDIGHAMVTRFVDLYQDGADLPPIVVMEDDAGKRWLVDGFRRWRACTRIGRQGIRAEVRHGSLEMARFTACGANRERLTVEEQRRAVALALTTPEGRRMVHRDLARYIGVPTAFVERVVGGVNDDAPQLPIDRRGQKSVSADAAIRDYFAKNPTASTHVAAAALGIDKAKTAEVRRQMGFKNAREVSADKLIRARKLWGINRDIMVSEMAQITGASYKNLMDLRDELGIPVVSTADATRKSRDPGRIERFLQQESAPQRPSNDPRSGSLIKVAYSAPPTPKTLGAMAAVEQLDDVEKARFADIITSRWPAFYAIPVSKV